ncbi:MAG: carbohydrate kinase family protein [Nanoarchaeota archaeon]|nr:carbohydrate kinase family protein [Nanoarchaeota archaeon]
MRFDVVTFGSAVVDVFVETGQRGKKIEYKTGSKILVDDLRFDIGGGATNCAVAFSRLGFKTGAICNVGDDNNGDDILDCLKKEGVKFLGSRVKGASGYSVILDSHGGGRTVLTYKGSGNFVSKVCDFDSKWLYYSSVLGLSLKTQIKLARKMKRRGTKLAFNPSEYLIGAPGVDELLSMSDVVVLNKEEFDLAVEKYGKGFCSGVVVVTDKDREVVAYNNQENRNQKIENRKRYFIRPHRVKVVERTGAGDAFASGFVASQIVGMSIEDGLKLGLVEGESVLGHFGAKNNLIRRKLK